MRIFNNSASSFHDIKDLVLTRLCWWIHAWNDGFPYSLTKVLRNPLCLKWKNPAPSLLSLNAQQLNMEIWSPPRACHLKWNVDASFDPRLDHAAVGGVLLNELGNFICIFSSPIALMEINSAGVYAIFRAIKISITSDRIKNHNLIIISDSANAVRWCNQESGGPWNLTFMLNFIRSVRKSWLSVTIHHKRHATNVRADALAKQGLRRMDEFLAWW